MRDSFTCGVKNCARSPPRAELFVPIASLRDGLRSDFAREGHGAGQAGRLRSDLIDDAAARAPSARLIGIADRAHFDRFGDTRQARQSLRSACAGNDAELHFGLADLRVGRRDAIVAGHRDFQSAAERRAVDRHDDRLARVFNREQKRQKSRTAALAGCNLAELLDVGAGDESFPAADQDSAFTEPSWLTWSMARRCLPELRDSMRLPADYQW